MFSFSLLTFFKYLIGILLVQGITILLMVTAFRTELEKSAILLLLLNLAIGALTAFWFTSMSEGIRKQSLSRAKEGFAREREKIRVRAEQQKAKEALTSQRQINRERQRARKGTNFKTALVLGGAGGLGIFMVLTQFVTLGLLTLTTAGGAALGYGLRARQEKLGWVGVGKAIAPREAEVALIEAPPRRQSAQEKRTVEVVGES